MSFSAERRAGGAEWMDDPGIAPRRFIASLEGLRRINTLTRSPHALWPIIERAAEMAAPQPLRVLDVACGGGDHIVALARRAERAALPVRFAGCDLSPLAVEYAASEARRANIDASFFQLDAVRSEIPAQYDLITSSFFLHHLDDDAAVVFLAQAARAATLGIAVYDLLRSRAGYALAWVGTRALLCNDVCRNDGPHSVASAFTLPEFGAVAARAGLGAGSLATRFPCRFLFTYWKESIPMRL